jgi:lysophospholipase L1-like esterase
LARGQGIGPAPRHDARQSGRAHVRRRLVYWLRVVGINLGLIAGGLLIAELLFGAWFAGNFAHVLFHLGGTTLIHDVAPLYEGGGKAVYRRDPFGLRGTYSSPATIDVLTIGGSTTDQPYIDEGQTFQDVLARRFVADGRSITVVNAGVNGQTTVGHLRAMDEWFPRIPNFQPKHILAYIGINDAELDDVDRSSYDRGDRLGRDGGLGPYIKRRSAIYLLYSIAKGAAVARHAKLGHSQGRVSGRDPATGASLWREIQPGAAPLAVDDALAKRLAAYQERVAELVRRIRATGARPIIVTQSRADYRSRDGRVFGRLRPDGTIDAGSYPKMSAYNRQALAACREAEAICIDLGAELWFEDADFYDAVHNTPSGAAKIGDYLFDRLKGRIGAVAR